MVGTVAEACRSNSYQYLNKSVAAEITTTIRNIAIEVPLGSREGLSKQCIANFDNLRTVARGYALAWDELIDLG